ncbi:DUF2190 family protein [bacterium]|nr:DUF2190 family protein [bacterium]NDD84372.1 DUF2190 family protein [bacterium]NDG19012.1 DUF2190 family protein [Betaproteobacteria bacterium]
MAVECSMVRDTEIEITLEAALNPGQLIQLPDGRAGFLPGTKSYAAGDKVRLTVMGVVSVAKTSGIVILNGGRVYWKYSTNAATYKKVNSRDFYIGRAADDAASSATTVLVTLNIDPRYDIDQVFDPFDSVATGTVAAGGFGLPVPYGASKALSLTATNEAQCIDMLSNDKFDVAANAIVEIITRIAANGSTNAVDLNFGVGNGTSTTDADAITQHVLFHIDGGATTINAQSKDGTTTVTATDTTTTFTAGSAVANRVEFWLDLRDPTNVKVYVNAVRVLSATTFTLEKATGPLALLAHLEKTSSTATAGPVYVDALRCRFMDQ